MPGVSSRNERPSASPINHRRGRGDQAHVARRILVHLGPARPDQLRRRAGTWPTAGPRRVALQGRARAERNLRGDLDRTRWPGREREHRAGGPGRTREIRGGQHPQWCTDHQRHRCTHAGEDARLAQRPIPRRRRKGPRRVARSSRSDHRRLDIHALNRLMQLRTFTTAAGRLAAVLLQYEAVCFGERPTVPRGQLSALAGVTPQMVGRIIRRRESEGILRRIGSTGLELLDRSGLEAHAPPATEFPPSLTDSP